MVRASYTADAGKGLRLSEMCTNNLKPYEYFEHLLTVIPEHMEDTDRSFLEELLPWSPALPENIRK